MVYVKANPPTKHPNKPKVRISYSISSDSSNRHRFGVNSLCLDGSTNMLYTAGRDSVIRQWQIDEETKGATFVASFESHIDWVNDVVLSKQHGILASCSSDVSIKLWDAATGSVRESMSHHQDYVKCLALFNDTLASGGLDKHIMLWDINTASLSATLEGHKDSVYSMAANLSGTVLVSGSTEKLIRVWDPRTKRRTCKLKGHRDTVRALRVKDDGETIVSASSDGTVKVWDLRTHRCTSTHSFHDGAVWALAMSKDFSVVYSGGRSGQVLATNLMTNETKLVCEKSAPVLKVQLSGDEQSCWVASTSSTVNCWSTPSFGDHPSTPLSPSTPLPPSIPLSKSPALAPSHAFGWTDNSSERVLLASIKGAAGIIKHHVMNNRREVLTWNDAGEVEHWDVTKGMKLRDYQKSSEEEFEALIKKIDNKKIVVPNWLSIDTKTGSITVHLNQPFCFSADVYRDIAGLTEDYNDITPPVNYGQAVLCSLFRNWKEGRLARLNEALLRRRPLDGDDADDGGDDDGDGGVQDTEAIRDLDIMRREIFKAQAALLQGDEGADAATSVFSLPDCTPVVIAYAGTGKALYRARVSDMHGREPYEVCPMWVAECVLAGRLWHNGPTHVEFTLEPAPGSDLQQIRAENRVFNTIPYFRIDGIIKFIMRKLAMENDVVEILCKGKVMFAQSDLITIRTLFWKSTEDLQLTYREAQQPEASMAGSAPL